MNIIKHNHADHIIIIEGHHFKANADGMWNLTDIWKTLKLPDNKRPSQWDNKEAKTLRSCVEISTQGKGNQSYVTGSKFATLQYAGWVSFEFNRMVYAAFEAVLAMPEVAEVVANKMTELGYVKEAELLERHKDAYSEAMKTMSTISKRVDGSKPSRVFEALKRGTITHEQALAQIPESSVWYDRVASWF